jgi:RimJ/RimL family protein N-acetyltransferase
MRAAAPAHRDLAVRSLLPEDVDWYAANLDGEVLRWSREEPIGDQATWWEDEGKHRLAIECCGTPVGAARVTVEAERVEIAYWIAPDHRRRGYATAALALLTADSARRHPDLPIELEIHPDNVASIRTAVAAGYQFLTMRSSCASCADDDGRVAIYGSTG